MRKKNFGKDVRISWLTVMVIMIFTPADIFVTDVSGISSVMCPPCSNWIGFCEPPPPECKCCFGVCCWSHFCFDCGGSLYNPCSYQCDPSQCEGCVNGGCTTDACYLDWRYEDNTGIKCACELGRCDPPGSIFYDFFCTKQCYGNCYCVATMGMQVVEQIPICIDIGAWPPGPECDETSDCLFKRWGIIIAEDEVACNCEHE